MFDSSEGLPEVVIGVVLAGLGVAVKIWEGWDEIEDMLQRPGYNNALLATRQYDE